MVPSVGSFFTPLKLVEAFNEYGEPIPINAFSGADTFTKVVPCLDPSNE